MVFGQKWPYFEMVILHLFMSLEISACVITLASLLSTNNALRKNFMFNSHPDFIVCGLFHSP